NKCFRPGAGVKEDVASHHMSDGAFDGRQSEDGLSLLSSRPGPFSLRVMEMATDRQTSDSPSWPSSPQQRFSGLLLKGRRWNRPSSGRWTVTLVATKPKISGPSV
ncbi:hypothetical protein HAX54_035515, partial [Datura stramonium]|nr:hypothetical protein [Datura stramonium]